MTKALARTSHASIEAWRVQKEQAQELLESGFLPNGIRTPAQAVAIIQVGRELDIGPMQAFSDVNIVQGKPCLSARLQLGLCFRDIPGFQFEVVESTTQRAEVRMRRNAGQQWITRAFSMADAKTAGLTGKQPWKLYPEDMLLNRAITRCVRLVGADAVRGMCYTPEELGADETPDDGAPVVVAAETVESVVVDEPDPPPISQAAAEAANLPYPPDPDTEFTAEEFVKREEKRLLELNHSVAVKNHGRKHDPELRAYPEPVQELVRGMWRRRYDALRGQEDAKRQTTLPAHISEDIPPMDGE